MQFTEWINKLKIKLFAPATICYRQMGQSYSVLKYIAWLPAFFIFKNEPIDKNGYYKRLYVNNKRFKPHWIIPRNAFVEIRQKPKFLSAILGVSLALATVSTFVASHAALIIGVAALAITAIVNLSAMTSRPAMPQSNGVDKPTYPSTDHPSLSGAKNELQTGVVPVAFGRSLQVFNYSQFCIPLVRSGYSGNRYRTYSIAGYQNARYSDFRLGEVPISSYRSAAYDLRQVHGGNTFIGWDNAITDTFNKELSFDQSQAIYQSAIVYYNRLYSGDGAKLTITQEYTFQNVNFPYWTNKIIDLELHYDSAVIGMAHEGIIPEQPINDDELPSTDIYRSVPKVLSASLEITTNDLVFQGANIYKATKSVDFDISEMGISEYNYTITSPNGSTRGNSQESELICQLTSETITITDTEDIEQSFTETVEQGVNSYNGDRNEIISQSPTEANQCDIHFSFPQGLYSIDKNSGNRIRVTIQAEVQWRRKGETAWNNLAGTEISMYTRDINGNKQPLSSRIAKNGNVFTFRTPDDINNADAQFYECVGIQFSEPSQYQIRVLPVVFNKDSYWVGIINVAEVVWRMPNLPVIDTKILPSVSQIACTFNATTQLDGEVDELGAIVFPYIKNLQTGNLEQSRNPVDIIYYLLTDIYSNPDPMTDDQIDLDSFLTARRWCEDHNCLCDGLVTGEIKYENIINEIASNNQLYFIPNKWGKVVLKVDTNEDGRPIKALFNAENSWDLSITRTRGKLGRLMALRCSYIDEETWSEQEITGYWYNNQCNWQPEEGKDDDYYKPEKRDLEYIKNADNVKRRIAYELEIANVKNTTATFKVAREVLDLDVLDRVLVADYTRIEDGVSGSIESLIYNETKTQIIGINTNNPFKVKPNMTITIRSVDISGEGFNVNTYSLIENQEESHRIMFTTPIEASNSYLRGTGFYNIEGNEIYYSGDLYMAGTAEILSMVISHIEEISGDDFTSKITCRLF